MSEHIYSLEQIKSRLTPVFQNYKVKKAILFGSNGTGTAGKNSDIDLLVDSGLKGLGFVGLMEDIRMAIDKDVQILDVTHIEKGSSIDLEICRTGVIIYADLGII